MLIQKFLLFVISFFMILFVNSYASDPGDKIEDFTLNNYDGIPYTLSSVKDSKAVVIMFWSTTCPNVQPYNERITQMASDYNKNGITFWAINANSTESISDIEAHAKKNGYPFPVLKDVNNVIADKLGASRTPEVFVISPERIILYHGRIDDNREASKVTVYDLKNALDEIIAGKDVTVKTTKAFGCGIKRNTD